jgi:diguanylate cyclase (GGDEF)-like protein
VSTRKNVTSVEPGFNPWMKLVHRLGRIAPHRQVQLLCLISVVTLGTIVATVLLALAPTHDSLANSNQHLLPAVGRLDVARLNYNGTASAFSRIVNADAATRASGINELTALNSAGAAAWSDYVKISAALPGEREFQRKFVTDRTAAITAGSAFVTDQLPTAEALAEVTQLANVLRLDLNKIKALYETRVRTSLHDAADEIETTRRTIMVGSGLALLVMLIAFGVASRSARAREDRTEELDRTLHEEAERNELEARLQRSLEMASTESDVFRLVSRALSITVPAVPAELLVADSSRAHFHQVAQSDARDGQGCQVLTPTECPAATFGQTQIWPSSSALDACPHLQGRPDGECSALCVPMGIGGKTVGVVHATGPDLGPPDSNAVVRVELIARKVGERVGMLRAFMRSETQAHTDPLTGLLNRRSLEDKVRGIVEIGRTYVAVYADLDHFKQLNDVHGHDAGDQALRLFARVMRETVRPDDLVARYGGEEFVIILPEMQISDAYAAINRLRERLESAQASGSGPRFTASFGVTAARPENTFTQTLEIADAALLKAKATGRDRIVISGVPGSDPEASAAPAAPDPVETPAPTPTSA